MNTFMHYEIEVTKQTVSIPFEKHLQKKGVDYKELAINPNLLPELYSKVVRYSNDGMDRYALIVPHTRADDYCESVYITSKIPDDCDWIALKKDVDKQQEGGEPEKEISRYDMIFKIAEQEAYDSLPDKKNIFNQEPMSKEEEMQIKREIRIFLARYGESPKEDLL